jgi:hypothetical protein
LVQVFSTADKIDHFSTNRIKEHPIDGEVAPMGILFGRTEMNGFGAPPIDIGTIASKSRDLDMYGAPIHARAKYFDHPKCRSYGEAPSK